MDIDTSRTIEIHRSNRPTVLLVAAVIASLGFYAFFADRDSTPFLVAVVAMATILFVAGGLGLLMFVQHGKGGGPAVRLSPDGVGGRALRGGLVPWSAVSAVTPTFEESPTILLKLEPDEVRRLRSHYRPMVGSGLSLKDEGLYVIPQSLTMNEDQLLPTLTAYWLQARDNRRAM